MSIEEKAKEYIKSPEMIFNYRRIHKSDLEDAFVDGANYMLDKVMNLIEDSVVFDKFGRPIDVENFRKAMEE